VNKDFYQYLRCPECSHALDLLVEAKDSKGIKQGNLQCKKCDHLYGIVNYIPRFVPSDNYARNFAFQWARFSKLRSDSYNKSNIIRNTILKRSGWDQDYLKGKLVLECGCGAGHDTEALLGLGAKVISFDLSNSVDVAVENNGSSNDVLVLQADIFKIPLQVDLFDVVYCHRVIQHTPEPENAFYSIARHARKGGDIFLHSYSTHWKSMVHWKYALRPITMRMSHERVFKLLTFFGPFLYRALGIARKLRLKFLRRIIPFDNSERALKRHNAQLTDQEKYEYSLTIVFDALTPFYDIPNSPKTITKWFRNAGYENIVVRKRRPVVVVGSRKTD